MKKIPFFVLIAMLFACKNEYQQNSEKMSKAILEYVKDNAFKENIQLNIIESNFIKYDTLNENYIDTLRLLRYLDKVDLFNQEMRDINKKMERELQSFRLYGDIDRGGSLWQNSKETLTQYQSEFKVAADSSKYYSNLDSLLRLKIVSRKKPEPIYRAKMFFKVTEKIKDQTKNTLDTLLFFFNKDLTIVKKV